MPLPASDTNAQWPPKQLDSILPSMARWSAWYSNDLDRLSAAYGNGAAGNDTTGFFASQTGGMKVHSIGKVRWFVGEPVQGASRNTKLPIPIAAEICQASADLLFSDPVTISVGEPVKTKVGEKETLSDNPTQQRLNELMDDSFHSTMAEAAEIDAALGGVYLRVTWDPTSYPDGPFSTVVDADMAIPEFRWGRLWAVTFWSVVHREGKFVYRHLERHELSPTGVGTILHGLYQGEEDKLGTRIGLTARKETEGLAVHQDLTLEGTIDTKSPGLAVQYIPNQTPNRMWRHDPLGRHLGRSDLDGVEHLLDQLAETMSDWMRARRAARARVMMSKDLVKSLGPGKGTVVDTDQETYIETGATVESGQNKPTLADRVQVLQPTFNPDQYKATVDILIEQILQMAGYSMQTFGVQPGDGGGDKTATEIEQKQQRSLLTRKRKIREWTPQLAAHVEKLLAIDRTFFGGTHPVAEITVEFADGVQESQIKLGQFVQSLFASESASVKERVAILHPDWDDTQIDDEVDLIKEEFMPAPMTDPIMDPFGPANGAAANQ